MKVKSMWFYASFFIYTIYSFTFILRWLPVVTVQMPIIILCYLFLMIFVILRFGLKKTIDFLVVSCLILIFNFFFIYLQRDSSNMSIVNKIGSNFTLFVTSFPILLIYSGGISDLNKKYLLNFVCLIVFVTAITTIVGTYIYPSPCRELATPYNIELDYLYKSKNIGGYGFIYFIVIITPLLLKKIVNDFNLWWIMFFAISSFVVIRSEYTIAIFLLIIGVFISIATQRSNIFVGIFIIIIISSFFIYVEDILNWLIGAFSESYTITSRIRMVLNYLKFNSISGDLLDRQNLYKISISTFLKNPFFGGLFDLNKVHVGGHSEILDYIAHSGLFGLIVIKFFISSIYKIKSYRRVKKDSYFLTMIIIAIILSLTNNFSDPELLYGILIMPILIENN